MNVLVVAPHPDDESLGCGGTLCLHRDRGDRVIAVFLTSGELGLPHLPADKARRIREREAESAAEILGIERVAFLRGPDWYLGDDVAGAAQRLAPILEGESPDLLYAPHAGEWHPDHRAALAVVQTALTPAASPALRLRTYEVWTPLTEFDHVEDITPVIRRKLRAIRAHRSQIEQLRYDRAARGLGQYRGGLAGGCAYAEVFASAAGRHPHPEHAQGRDQERV